MLDPQLAQARSAIELSEAAQAVEALRKERDFVAAVFDTVSTLLLVLDRQGRIVRFNRACERATGYSFAEVEGRQLWDLLLTPEEHAPVRAVFEQLCRGESPNEHQNLWVAKDGTHRLIAWSNSVLLDDAGRPEYILGAGIDMTERQRAEQAQREAETRFRTLVEQLPAITYVAALDQSSSTLYTSPQIEAMLGFSQAEWMADHQLWLKQIHPGDRERVLAELEQSQASGQPVPSEYRVLTRDGEVKWFRDQAVIVKGDDGQPLFLQGFMFDITDRKHIDRMKNEFVSMVSHELRTPLTSIRGALGLIAGGVAGEVAPHVRTMVDIAYKNSERLGRLIDDILDIEKIESGKMVFDLKPIELGPLVEHMIEANRAYGKQFQVGFALESHIEGVEVCADADRLAQALTNLLSNAVKFSPPDETVVISVAPHPIGVRIAVIDRGFGIPDEFRDRIFQKFAQADSSTTRQRGGSGLGLSITKAIVEKLGGQISFESTLGAGTSFFLDLPLWRAPQPAIIQAPVALSAELGASS
jgi:PAS domain S-box-containing protein